MQDTNDISVLFRSMPDAMAILKGSEKYPAIYGRVMFYEVAAGVILRTDVVGLPQGQGTCASPIFALHIHDGDACSGDETDPFADAGMHLNSTNCPHPYHAGDLPPLFGAAGKAFSAVLTDRFSLQEIIGKTVVLHARPDDFATQPAGGAGEKIACGVIKK